MSDAKCEAFTLGALLRDAAQRHGARTFLEFPDGTQTYAEADARAKSFATRYYSADLHKGAQALPPFVAEALAG